MRVGCLYNILNYQYWTCLSEFADVKLSNVKPEDNLSDSVVKIFKY